MMRLFKSFLRVGVLSVLSLVAPRPLFAQNQYQGIPFPPYEFYEVLVGAAQRRQFGTVVRLLPYLNPLFETLEREEGENPIGEMDAALEKQDAFRLNRSILKLVYLDMQFNLAKASSATEVKSKKERILMAFVNYSFLSHPIKIKDRALDKRFKERLRVAYHEGNPQWKGEAIKELMEQVQTILFRENR